MTEFTHRNPKHHQTKPEVVLVHLNVQKVPENKEQNEWTLAEREKREREKRERKRDR
jgi:hypothetical protein